MRDEWNSDGEEGKEETDFPGEAGEAEEEDFADEESDDELLEAEIPDISENGDDE